MFVLNYTKRRNRRHSITKRIYEKGYHLTELWIRPPKWNRTVLSPVVASLPTKLIQYNQCKTNTNADLVFYDVHAKSLLPKTDIEWDIDEGIVTGFHTSLKSCLLRSFHQQVMNITARYRCQKANPSITGNWLLVNLSTFSRTLFV